MERVIKKMDVEQSEMRAPPTPQQLKPSKVRDQRLMDLSANRLTMTADFLPTELDCSCHIVPSSSGSGLAGNVVNQNSFGKVCLSFAISACKTGQPIRVVLERNSVVLSKHFSFLNWSGQ